MFLHVSARVLGASVIPTHIRTEGLYVKTTIIYQLKRLCVPDFAYTENMFKNSIHISLYDLSLTQNILYQIKRDVAVWKGALVCMCRMYRSAHRDVPGVFVCIGMGAHACIRHIPNVPTQTYRHNRDKMAIVAVRLATIPDNLAELVFVNT